MPDFVIGDSEQFEAWQTAQRLTYQQKVTDTLFLLASHCEAHDLTLAHLYAQKLVSWDKLDERGQELSLRILARQGQRGAALTQFEQYRQELNKTFGVMPTAQLQTLVQQIRLNQWPQNEAIAAASPAPPPFPSPVKLFLGREKELSALADLLHNPACRLLTITGFGGVGKSALARALARQQENRFRQGVCLVNVAEAHTIEAFYEALGSQLGLIGEVNKARVLECLRPQHILLVCDGLDGVQYQAHELVDLLRHTSGCKIVTTSRTCLNVTGEWIYPLHRLESGNVQSAAVQLFLQYARQSHPNFAPTPHDLEKIQAICDLLRGNPLWIEMAASWLRVLSCDALWQELRHDLHFLTGVRQDIPRHHRSAQALFENTWHTLSATERMILERLSVFRRHFTWDEAAWVAQLSLPMMADFLDRSLLVREADQVHYGVPEMMRRFAAAYLRQDHTLYQTTMQLFSHWYADFLARQTIRLYSYEQLDALHQIRDEWINIEQAWQWAVAAEDHYFMAQSVNGLSRYFDMTGQFEMGRAWFAAALAHTAWETQNQGHLFIGLGWMYARLYQKAEAQAALATGLQYIEAQGETPQMIMGLAFLARAYTAIGDLSEAQIVLQKSITLSRHYNDNFGASLALTAAGVLAQTQGEWLKAERLLDRARMLKHIVGDLWGAAEIYQLLGELALHQQGWEITTQRLTEALNIWKTFNDGRRTRQVMMQLGYVAGQQQAWETARRWYQNCLHLAEAAADEPCLILAYQRLGAVARAQGQWAEAMRFYQRALPLEHGTQKLHAESRTILAAIGMLMEAMRPQTPTFVPAIVDPSDPLSASLIQELNQLFQGGKAWRPQVEWLVQTYLGDVEKLTADLW
jgi:tetratricopeptide (TPR) repeat protein